MIHPFSPPPDTRHQSGLHSWTRTIAPASARARVRELFLAHVIGGRRLKVVATAAYDEFLGSLNWPLGAAIAVLLIAPQSLARLHHRKDLTYRPLTDAPPSPVVLAVPAGEQSEAVAEFIGVVRGRKAGSSRGRTEPAPKRTAREKTLAKQAARAAAGKSPRLSKGKPAKRPRR